MKKSLQLKPLLLSLAVAGAAAASFAPAAAQAGEVSYNAAVSNMYLWRGLEISNGPAVSGGIDYDFGNGFAIGTWASSESAGNQEVDLYGSYGMTVGGVDLSIGYAAYLYPQQRGAIFKYSSDDGSMLGDYIIGAGYGDLAFTAYIDAEGDDHGNNVYYTLDYAMGDFGLHAGLNTNDDSNAEYAEFNVSYAATENLSFVLSQADGDALTAEEEHPLVQVTYSFTF